LRVTIASFLVRVLEKSWGAGWLFPITHHQRRTAKKQETRRSGAPLPSLKHHQLRKENKLGFLSYLPKYHPGGFAVLFSWHATRSFKYAIPGRLTAQF
jgi:hypothetical protein